MNKKRNVIICIIFCVVAVVTFFALRVNGDNGYRTVSVIEVHGTVSVVKDGIEYKAYPGMKLSKGHEIVTAGNAYVRMLLDDDKYIKLEAGSKLVFEELSKFGTSKTHLRLERGAITSEIVKPLGNDDEFIVNTPNSILAVRGTFFRIDMGVNEEGDIVSDIMTYGGLVVSKRVEPNGTIIDEEIGIAAGQKASIQMDKKDTKYVVDEISIEEISDEDLIDIYFAAENGHSMFAALEEIKTDLKERNININEQESVYNKVDALKKKPLANDSKPLAKEENTEKTEIREPINDGNAHTHTMITTIYKPTCENDGKEVISCVACKEILVTTKIAALGHTMGDWEVEEEASCVQNGVQKKQCNNCDYTEKQEIMAEGHKVADWIVTTEPTCKVPGYAERICEKCDDSVEIKQIPTLEHEYEEYFYTDIAPSCETEGVISRHCKVCDDRIEITQLPARGHIYGEWENLTEAVCGTKGKRQRQCSVCEKYEEGEYVAKEGHTPDGNTMGCHITCLNCNEAVGLGGEYSGVVIEHATCIKEGVMQYTCACGSYQTTGSIPLEDHDYDIWLIITEPTCMETGLKTRRCMLCGIEEEEIIPKTEHRKLEENADVTSCRHCGETMIAANSNVFPDSNVLQYITSLCDKDLDGIILGSEMEDIKEFKFGDPKYADLTGINNFKQIESLSLEGNWTVADLDLSGCENLKELNLNSCGSLRTLNLSGVLGPITINITGIAMTPVDFETTIKVTKDDNLAVYYTVS